MYQPPSNEDSKAAHFCIAQRLQLVFFIILKGRLKSTTTETVCGP